MTKMRAAILLAASSGLLVGGLRLATARGDDPAMPGAARKVHPKVTAFLKERDKNGDGVLEASEVPEYAARVREADKDGDGKLGPWELYRTFALDKLIEKSVKKDDLARKFAEADADGDGAVVREEFPAPDMLFDKVDRDGDARIVIEELLAYGVEEELAKGFAERDADLSGTLGKDELDDEGREIFDLIDTDGDGAISGQEAYALLYEVALAAHARRSNGGGAMPGPRAAAKKTDAKPGAAASAAGRVLATMLEHDADGDGALSATEFPGTGTLHRLIDIDRDGRVDEAELSIRQRFAEDLGTRGQRLRGLAESAGVTEAELALIGQEVKGLFDAGRLEDVKVALDEIELRLLRRTK